MEPVAAAGSWWDHLDREEIEVRNNQDRARQSGLRLDEKQKASLGWPFIAA